MSRAGIDYMHVYINYIYYTDFTNLIYIHINISFYIHIASHAYSHSYIQKYTHLQTYTYIGDEDKLNEAGYMHCQLAAAEGMEASIPLHKALDTRRLIAY